MEPERRKQILLIVLGLILAAFGYRAWSSAPASSGAPAGVARTSPTAGQPSAGSAASFDVHLRQLQENRRDPVEGTRNLFRFRPKPPPTASLASSTAAVPSGPPQPPPLPPISLKFIGVIERPERSEKIAVLRDPTGHLWSGHEGAIIEGRFRILRIGAESIELAYLDGRGRQTIRLSGA
jgi:hypothetical protein